MGAVEFRILSYNVRSLRDDKAAVAHVVRACDPDVVCVQEAPRFLRWRAKCAALARESGLLYVTGGRTAAGVALLASLRVDVLSTHEGLLTKRPRREQRGLAAAVVRKSGTRLLVVSMHMSLDADERRVHAGEVLSLLGQLGEEHVVLAGDLNELPGQPAWQAYAEGGLRDADPSSGPTYPSGVPHKRIDGVLVSDGVEVVSQRVVDEPGVERATDHRPVLAVVRVPASG